MQKISCLIPAYNEEEQIERILNTLNSLIGSVLQEVIVIDDFSSDNTKQIVKRFQNVVLVEHTKNEGKSKAIADGIEKATGGYILMLDGDLIGLNEGNIFDLINPLLKNLADITISYRGNTPRWWIRFFKIETFSGERCFPRDFLVNNLGVIKKLPGYGLEVYMNQEIIRNGLRIKSVPMNNVKIKFKWHKHGLVVGVWKELIMWKNIFAVVSPRKLLLQVLEMKKLVVP